MWSFNEHSKKADRWKALWGSTYNEELKQKKVKPILEQLAAQGKLGEFLVDVGSGGSPISKNLTGLKKIVTIDFGGSRSRTTSELHIQSDVERLDELTFSAKKELLKFLDASERQHGADSMLFSDILNYVDYKKVLTYFARFLKPGGVFVIVNMPHRGKDELFSKRGMQSNAELQQFLESLGFTVTQKEYLIAPHDYEGLNIEPAPEDKRFILLVAEKASP